MSLFLNPAQSWTPSITKDELLASIEDTAPAMDANLRRRVEHTGAMPLQVVKEAKKKKISLPGGALALQMLSRPVFMAWLGGDNQN